MNKIHFSIITFLLSLSMSIPCSADRLGVIQLASDADYNILCVSSNGKWACGIKQNVYEDTGHGFRWNLTTGKIELFSENSEANKVSDDGVVAGGYYTRVDGKNVERAALWNGSWTDLAVPSDGYETWATSITPDGKYICGCCYTTSGGYVGYVWNSDGSVRKKLDAPYTSMPVCISDDGSMVGGWVQKYNRVPGWWTVNNGNWNYVDESLKGGPWFQVKKIYSNNKDLFYYGGYTLDPERTDSVYGLKSFYNIDSQKASFIYPLADKKAYSFEMFDTNSDGTLAVGYEQTVDDADLAVVWEKSDSITKYIEDWLTTKGADFLKYDIAYANDTIGDHLYICRAISVSNDGKVFGLDYYDTEYNIHSMIVMLDQNVEHTCPVNLEATQISGLNVVKLTWNEPLGDKSNLTGYDIYRNGIKVGSKEYSGASETYYDQSVEYGSYSYTVKAVYTDGESDFSQVAGATVAERPAQAPQGFIARQRGYNSGLLKWALPKTNMTPCSYVENGLEMDAFGGGGVSFESGTLFDKETMALYKDLRLTAVSFMPKTHQGSWIINVYTHENDSTLKKLMTKAIKDDDLVIGEFNTIRLPKQVKIPDGQDMLIGIVTNVTEDSYDVQGIYENCLIIGKTDLVRQVDVEEDFYSVNEMGQTDYDMAWATTALFAAEGATEDVDAIDHYNVYVDGSKQGETKELSYITSSLSDGGHSVAVDALYQNGKQSDKVSTSLDIVASVASLPAITPSVTTSGQTVTATWETPTDCDPSALGWCTDVNGSHMPKATEDAPSISARVDFYSEEHKSYDGYQVTGVSFKPMSSVASYEAYIYENGEEIAEVYPDKVEPGVWNTFQLEEPVTIKKGSLYYYVVSAYGCDPGEVPVATDADDAVNDHSDIYSVADEMSWYNLTELGAKGNWMMQLNLVDPDNGEPLDATYDILLDGKKDSNQSALTYSKTYPATDPGDHSLQVNAVYSIASKKVTREGSPVDFHLSTSGIEEVISNTQQISGTRNYNLAGQRVGSNYNGVIINNNNKVISIGR